jgi:hypothetical protein
MVNPLGLGIVSALVTSSVHHHSICTFTSLVSRLIDERGELQLKTDSIQRLYVEYNCLSRISGSQTEGRNLRCLSLTAKLQV